MTALVALCTALTWVTACGSDFAPAAGDDLWSSGGGGGGGDQCGHPNPGCPCTQVGEEAECGHVKSISGSTITCSVGKVTCDGTLWGPCVGDVDGRTLSLAGGLTTAGLGSVGTCVGNPCDPNCKQIADTPYGLDAGRDAGLTTDDAGMRLAGDPCVGALCPVVTCGDGVVGLGEECDDKNLTSLDGCSSTCKVELGYTCPTPGVPCIATPCGDSLVKGQETCDDGNSTAGDGCSSTCKVETGWQCVTPGTPCVAKLCGDGLIRGNEECDDGDGSGGDGCSATCMMEDGWKCSGQPSVCSKTTCGDGVKEGSEQCDDGNRRPYDGCSPTCDIEPSCTGGTCTAVCGDGLKFPTEQCDDGNTKAGDGCSPTCTIEAGFACTDSNSTPTFLDIPILYRDMLYNTCKDGGQVPSVASTKNDCCSAQYKTCGSSGAACTVATQAWDCCSGTCNAGTSKCSGSGTAGSRCLPSQGDGHPDFEKQPGPGTGLVNATLGADGRPVWASNGSNGHLTGAANFYWWYHSTSPGGGSLPPAGPNPYAKEVFLDSSGNPTVLHLLQQTPPATATVYKFASTSFFNLDGLGWESIYPRELDKNNSSAPYHNYSFTSELHYPFQYLTSSPEMTFTFKGDDDVWAFINGHLVADLGGQHGEQTATFIMNATGTASSTTIAFDTKTTNCKATSGTASQTCNSRLGLVDKGMYTIDVFHAERHVTGSNYTLTLGGFVHTTSVCSPVCGDGLKKGSEQCDDGVLNGAYGTCKAGCTRAAFCGDGIKNGPEQCDDGTNATTYGGTSSTACAPGCVFAPYCGDGVVSNTEQCDDGAANGLGTCLTDCTRPFYYARTYTRDYAATCLPGFKVVWLDAGVKATFPISGGTYPSLQIGAQVGDTTASLSSLISIANMTGPPVDQTAAWTNHDLTTPLKAANVSYPNKSALRLSLTLTPSTDHASTPTLTDWRARFDCIAAE